AALRVPSKDRRRLSRECCAVTHSDMKPTTHQRNLAKLPSSLTPLIERPQWCNWRWTQKPDGRWQKPPFMSTQPERYASTNDPNTWADYHTALAAVQAGHADGISYSSTNCDRSRKPSRSSSSRYRVQWMPALSATLLGQVATSPGLRISSRKWAASG